jgi:hypothetical protein
MARCLHNASISRQSNIKLFIANSLDSAAFDLASFPSALPGWYDPLELVLRFIDEATVHLTCCGLAIRSDARRESGKGVTQRFRSMADFTGHREPVSAALPDDAQQ